LNLPTRSPREDQAADHLSKADAINHDLKNLFKSASAVAAAKAGPFQKFYDAQIGKGLKPEMARLTLARKIAAITLIVWKKGVSFDARYLNPQTA